MTERKQENIEEDAETKHYRAINTIIDGGKDLVKGVNVSRGQAIDYAFSVALKTAAWQQKRMFSNEEVKTLVDIINWYDNNSDVCPNFEIPEIKKGIDLFDWFIEFKKQFKKK